MIVASLTILNHSHSRFWLWASTDFVHVLYNRRHTVKPWVEIWSCAVLVRSVNCIMTHWIVRKKYSKWKLNCVMFSLCQPISLCSLRACCQPVLTAHWDCDGGDNGMIVTYICPPCDPYISSNHHHHTIPAQQRCCLAVVTLGNHIGGRPRPSLSPSWISVSLSGHLISIILLSYLLTLPILSIACWHQKGFFSPRHPYLYELPNLKSLSASWSIQIYFLYLLVTLGLS